MSNKPRTHMANLGFDESSKAIKRNGVAWFYGPPTYVGATKTVNLRGELIQLLLNPPWGITISKFK